jgi:hypothetical protein
MSLWRRTILNNLIPAGVVSLALSACAPTPAPAPITKAEPRKEPPVEMSERVQSLEKQLRERDKRIEELESQLEALKLIDQEHERQRKPVKPPTLLESIQ